MEEVEFVLTYYNLDTEETEEVVHIIPLEVAQYMEDIAQQLRITLEAFYDLKANHQLLTHTLIPHNRN